MKDRDWLLLIGAAGAGYLVYREYKKVVPTIPTIPPSFSLSDIFAELMKKIPAKPDLKVDLPTIPQFDTSFFTSWWEKYISQYLGGGKEAASETPGGSGTSKGTSLENWITQQWKEHYATWLTLEQYAGTYGKEAFGYWLPGNEWVYTGWLGTGETTPPASVKEIRLTSLSPSYDLAVLQDWFVGVRGKDVAYGPHQTVAASFGNWGQTLFTWVKNGYWEAQTDGAFRIYRPPGMG